MGDRKLWRGGAGDHVFFVAVQLPGGEQMTQPMREDTQSPSQWVHLPLYKNDAGVDLWAGPRGLFAEIPTPVPLLEKGREGGGVFKDWRGKKAGDWQKRQGSLHLRSA